LPGPRTPHAISITNVPKKNFQKPTFLLWNL